MIAQRFSAGKGGFMNSEPASAGGTNGLSKEHLCRPRGTRIRNSRPPRPEGRGYHLSRPRRSGIGNAGAGRVPARPRREKLEQALAIFTELKMPRERDAVKKELEKVASG